MIGQLFGRMRVLVRCQFCAVNMLVLGHAALMRMLMRMLVLMRMAVQMFMLVRVGQRAV